MGNFQGRVAVLTNRLKTSAGGGEQEHGRIKSVERIRGVTGSICLPRVIPKGSESHRNQESVLKTIGSASLGKFKENIQGL